MLRTFRTMLDGGLAHGKSPIHWFGARRSALRAAAALFCLLTSGSTKVHADRIHLRTGETIKGKLIPDPSNKSKVLLYRETGKSAMTLSTAQVVKVDREPSVLDEYAVQRQVPATSAQAEFDLGEWCATRGLTDLAAGHYEAALKQDPNFAPAHEALGHVQIKGQWLNRDQARSASGMIYHKGKWITPEEAEQKKLDESASAEQTTWQRKLTVLLRSYRSGPENRRGDVENQILAIRDNAAIQPLLKTFGSATEPEARILAARGLAAIPTPEAAGGLVTRLLAEGTQSVREATLDELAKRDEQVVTDRLTSALRSKSTETLNRAAWALGKLKAVHTVPKLIPALVTVEQRMVWVDPSGGENSLPGTPVINPNTEGMLLSGGRNIPVLTGPAVAPGAIAYGATSVPAIQFYSGMNASLPGLSRGPVPKMQSYSRQNTEVLAALQALTGQDFGYDIAAWRRWVGRTYQPDPVPVRRVPQP